VTSSVPQPATGPTPPAREWRPSLWLRSLTSLAPAAWPVGRSVRAAVSVAGPLLVAALLGEPLIGMWISMGTLLMAAGERSVAYGARMRQILVTAPIAAAAYLLGMLSHAPPPVTVGVMAALAFGSGILSGWSAMLSVGTMQGMLIAAIAIGVPGAAPYWPAALLFLGGAILYALLLALEAAIDRRRPQRDALVSMLRSLAALSRISALGSDLAAERARTTSAIDAYERIAITRRGTAQGPTREYARAAQVTRAADQLLARLLAHDVDASLATSAAGRLDELADAVAHRRRPAAWSAPPGTLVRLRLLESAIWEPQTSIDDAPVPDRARLAVPGADLLASAGRLALCTALAYAAYFVLPVPHGYWIPLTVALVMKPDLGSVFSRAVLRSIGTVGGAVIALVAGLLMADALLGAVAIGVLAACLPWAMARSYALQAVFLTPLIMVLISTVVPAESIWTLTLARLATTAIGGVIVVVAGYAIWPSARHPRIEPVFDRSLDALVRYAQAVASGQGADAIAGARRAAFRSLSDAKVTLQRTLSEPPPAGAEAWAWIPVVTAAERVADRITDASGSRSPLDTPLDAAALAAMAADLESFASRDAGGDSATRDPSAPRHGGDSPDPAVRELADEIATVEGMLTRRHPIRADPAAGTSTSR